MSAYVVSNNTIAAILLGYVKHSYELKGEQEKTTIINEIGTILLRENVRSVAHRYKDDEDSDKLVEFKITKAQEKKLNNLSNVELLKLCHCLEYQSCECDDWESTEAYKRINAIKSEIESCLDGYEEARWGLPENIKDC